MRQCASLTRCVAAGREGLWLHPLASPLPYAICMSSLVMCLQEYGDIAATISDMQASIVRQLEEKVLEQEALLLTVGTRIAELDVIASFASAARDYGYTRPKVTDDTVLIAKAARHPLLERRTETSFTPNDIVVSGTQAQQYQLAYMRLRCVATTPSRAATAAAAGTRPHPSWQHRDRHWPQLVRQVHLSQNGRPAHLHGADWVVRARGACCCGRRRSHVQPHPRIRVGVVHRPVHLHDRPQPSRPHAAAHHAPVAAAAG